MIDSPWIQGDRAGLVPKMRVKILYLFLFSFATLALLAGGCVLTMPDPLLRERNLEAGIIPLLKGKWKDDQGATLTINPTSFNNTFTAISSSKEGEFKVIMERLNESHFILQLEPAGGQGVFLTIAEVMDKRINIYTYPETLEEIRKKGEKHDITITEAGLITSYEDSKEVVAFFRELALMPNHVNLVLTKK